MKIDFEYNLGDKVKIIALENTEGVVISLWSASTGIQYEVAYWHESKRYKEYMFGFELVRATEVKR